MPDGMPEMAETQASKRFGIYMRGPRLSDLLKKGPVILTFYRGGWCPFCNLQLKSYQAHLAEIRTKGAELVAVSPQINGY